MEVCFILDLYRVGFLITVRVIAGRIYVFSIGYIQQEKFFLRFHLLVGSFVASMALLILSPNLVSLLLGWDGLGLTSYLLVIYFQRTKSFNAGMITALRNRVGDVLILLAIAILLRNSSWNFVSLSLRKDLISAAAMALITFAACTKSAQIPFSAWLPAAMAAPTPVSSLVHSSTLVTAGVYLLFRFSRAFALRKVKLVVLSLGALTILIAGLAALLEIDMKKIIALSTLRQLGVIIITLGTGAFLASYFHILSHAFFKALLFITIGAIIHMANDYQDLRKTSILPPLSPLTIAFSLGANLSLCGLPFLRGFYSKDLCIELEVTSAYSLPLTLIFYLATALTAAYTARLMGLLLSASEKSPRLNWCRDKSKFINPSMTFLYALSLAGRGAISWLIYFYPVHPPLTFRVKALVYIVILLGARLMVLSPSFGAKAPTVFLVYCQMWALPYISSRSLTLFFSLWGTRARSLGDQFWAPALTYFSLPPFIRNGLLERAASQEIDIFRSLSFLGLLLMRILLYLYGINFFI